MITILHPQDASIVLMKRAENDGRKKNNHYGKGIKWQNRQS